MLDGKMTDHSYNVFTPVHIVFGQTYDAARAAGTYIETRSGFFTHHHMPILPYPASHCVYLPDLIYPRLRALKRVSTYHPDGYDKPILAEIENQIDSTFDEKKISHIQKKLPEYFSSSIPILFQFFPETIKKIKSISLIATKYGTECSFDYHTRNGAYEIYIWIREDRFTTLLWKSTFIHGLVSALVLIKSRITDSTNPLWMYKEFLIDFLLHDTTLAKLMPKRYKTTPQILSPQFGHKIYSDSMEYLKKLGLSSNSTIIKKDDHFYFSGKKIEHLTRNEHRTLEYLYEKAGSYIHKNELLSVVIQNNEGSDWSIAKLIQRLRNKLSVAGNGSSPIFTSRKRGYMLKK